MSSSVTSSHGLASGNNAPFLVGSSSSRTSSLTASSPSVTSDVLQQTYYPLLSSTANTVSGMSGLLNSKSLFQATEDEKLVVATLATLDSGSASTLIKQDLKWIIQSRRKAEGKEEIRVEFKKPVKDKLTSEEVVKRMRRRELNRLAARRSREKGQKRKDKLVEEINLLQSRNSDLISDLTFLTDERDNIINTLRQHMKECSDYTATRNAAASLPRRILNMLGFLHEPLSPSHSSSSMEEKSSSSLALSNLYIDTSPVETANLALVQKSHLHQKSATAVQSSSYSSCPPSPVITGLPGTPLFRSSASFDSNPPVFQLSASSSSSAQTPILSATTTGEESSRLSQDSAFSFSSSSNSSPRRAHSFHHSPWHESSSSSSPQKHYIHSDEFTRPTSPIKGHPSRFSLERSISCPSSTVKVQTHYESLPSPHSNYNPSAEMSEDYFSSYSSTASGSSRRDESFVSEQDIPLDLVVRATTTDSINDEFSSSSMDTWPRRSNSKLGLTRGVGRRWSVDDQRRSSLLWQPLNLSTRHGAEDGGKEDPSLS